MLNFKKLDSGKSGKATISLRYQIELLKYALRHHNFEKFPTKTNQIL